MGVHEGRTFRRGRSVALRLPDGLAIGPGERMLIEAEGGRLTVSRVPNRGRVTRKLRALLAVLEAIGGPRRQRLSS
jgi:virulence-associated protein VagC